VDAARKQGINFLTVATNKTCTRNLRGAVNDTTFVSFLTYASEGTTLDIGGAKLAVIAAGRTGYFQLAIGEPGAAGVQWRPIGEFAKIERHDGAALAALPVLTVRVDPKAGVWDLYSFSRLVAEDLRLFETKVATGKQCSLTAGKEGAWLCGLVSSDENPLFVDANGNGIDDKFEKQQRGSLLAANATSADRLALAHQWKENQRTINAAPWKVRRPLPDAP
jgi:hypothetical protein